MKPGIDPKVWAEEFQSFVNAPAAAAPENMREEIFSIVHRDLNPSFWLVLAKLGGIHAFVGSFSLLLCEQFGMGRGDAVMRLFMGYGMNVCMAFCGALFLGLTTIAAGFLLTNPELKKIRRTAYAPIWTLGLLSLAIFLFFGAKTALGFSFAWLLGAVLAGILFTEASIGLRRIAFRHA